MGRAKFRISESLLRSALHMPETSRIYNIRMDDATPGCIIVVAEDPSLPGGATHDAEVMIKLNTHGSGDQMLWDYSWDWNVKE